MAPAVGDPIIDGFKPVPDSMEEITPEWLDWALKKNGTIGADVKVSDTVVKSLTNESGVEGGGGMTDAKLVRIALEYNGNVTGKEPSVIIGKVLLQVTVGENMPLHWRILLQLMKVFGNKTAEELWRTDIKFCREAIPLIQDTYQYPKVYYTGMNKIVDRSKFSAVVLNKPCKLKTITLMEDMKGWKSSTIVDTILDGGLSNENAEAVLKNEAILHAAFWGEKSDGLSVGLKEYSLSEFQFRPAAHNWMIAKGRKNTVSSISNCEKVLKKAIEQWEDHSWFTANKNLPMPSWFTAEALEDGSFPILKDPTILEMLEVFGKRYPQFNAEVASHYLKKSLQTLVHGDFQAGNHMYGVGEHKGKIVAFDFQCVGLGLAVTDLISLFIFGIPFQTHNEKMELMNVYHDTLVQNGVTDYTWGAFKEDLIVGTIEYGLKVLMDISKMPPKKYISMFKLFGDKFDELKKWFDEGIFGLPLFHLTSLYVNNKEEFLIPDKFMSNL